MHTHKNLLIFTYWTTEAKILDDFKRGSGYGLDL